jgi:hypothetical protein
MLEYSPKITVYLTPNYTVLVGDYHEASLDKIIASRDVEAPWLP